MDGTTLDRYWCNRCHEEINLNQSRHGAKNRRLAPADCGDRHCIGVSDVSSVTTYYLEMTSPEQLKAKGKPAELEITEAEVKQFKLNRFLYELIGEKWSWKDKLNQTDEEWKQYAESDNVRTWVAYCKGSIAGYYELERQSNGNVEIAYFGLSPCFIGKGYGGYLLTHAIQSAWSWVGAKRVWVHTCSLDHEGALSNYKARGLRVYETITN